MPLSYQSFQLAAAASFASYYGFTRDRDPAAYGAVLGLPSYLFWGIVFVDVVFVLALAASVRWLFQDMDLDPVDPALDQEGRGH